MVEVKFNYTDVWSSDKGEKHMSLRKGLVLENGGLNPRLSGAKTEYDALCKSMYEFIKKAEEITGREARFGKLEVEI